MLRLEIELNGQMVLVDAGEFVMGDDNGDADERPAHKVSLPAFYIDRYEVTNAQYRKFCESTGTKPPPTPWEPNYFDTQPDGPVLGVQFKDATAYASWAGKRLPTEEEWEKAASWDPVAQRKRIYPWGDDSPETKANIGNGKITSVHDYKGDVSPYGVYGMAGNANEWVNSLFTLYKGYNGEKIPSEANNPEFAVIRGGSCFVPGKVREQARASRRNFLQRSFPEGKVTPVGFRCAASADDAMQAQAK
jgi:iron(II)-dependent oxidoreductase